MEAIRESELVIIEDTVSNFSTGHQITLVLQMRKPTPLLWQSKKHKHFNQVFIHGIESDLLQVAEYAKESLDNIFQTFINTYEDKSEKNLFHLATAGVNANPWIGRFTGNESRTRVIREALRYTIKHDPGYQTYLQHKQSSQKQRVVQ